MGCCKFICSTVRFRIREVGSTTVLSTITGTITGASTGEVTIAFPSSTWTTAGTFGEIETHYQWWWNPNCTRFN